MLSSHGYGFYKSSSYHIVEIRNCFWREFWRDFFEREREEQLKFENAAYFETAHRFAEYKTQTNKNSKKRETNNVTRFGEISPLWQNFTSLWAIF